MVITYSGREITASLYPRFRNFFPAFFLLVEQFSSRSTWPAKMGRL